MQVAIDVFSALLTPVIAAIAVYIAYQASSQGLYPELR